VNLTPADIASRERLKSVRCESCGDMFDARLLLASSTTPEVSDPAKRALRNTPRPQAPAGSTLAPGTAVKDPPKEALKTKEVAKEAPKKESKKPETPEEKESAAKLAKLSRKMPAMIGNYKIMAEVNRGGMGIVYRALDTMLRREVAIKVLLAGEGATDEDVKRFQRETQMVARLHHPNIVPIHAVGTHEGRPYFVMDFVEGRTARQLKEEGLMTPRLALHIIEGVAEALHHAHGHGVIHRDVKPANIIVDKHERSQLTDFGLARRVDEDLDITQSGTTMGTPSYMAPEQAEGKLTEVDAQSDVYSAGACLYELLTGQPPFDGPTVLSVLRQVLDNPPIPPRKLNPKIHRDVETICLKCLEKEKANRYASGKALAEDIRRFNAGEVIAAKPTSLAEHFFRTVRRNKQATLAVGGVVLIVLLGLGYTLNERRNVRIRQMQEQAEKVRDAIKQGNQKLTRARDAMEEQGADESRLNQARARISEAKEQFSAAAVLEPDNQELRVALQAAAKLDNTLEVQRYVLKARFFLNPTANGSSDAPILPNYAAAESWAQEALAHDKDNQEAKDLLRQAKGIRTVSIDCVGASAEVYTRLIVDALGRKLDTVRDVDPREPGVHQGTSPIQVELDPGVYVVTFVRGGMASQEATLSVDRDSHDDESLRITINAPEENMVAIPEGTVQPLYGQDSKTVPAFSIDRFEFPNRAGVIPRTGVQTLADAQEMCKSRGKQLCTAQQWIRACSGDKRRMFPYGDTLNSRACASDQEGRTEPVLSGFYSRCRTPEGIYDMAGNAGEWADGQDGQQAEILGGDWTSPTKFADLFVSCRAHDVPKPELKDRVGVRCCKVKK
jgi:hypothetical protein